MDATYSLFHRLVVHWHQSFDAGDNQAAPLSGPEQHARRLIAQCGRSWESDSLSYETDGNLVGRS